MSVIATPVKQTEAVRSADAVYLVDITTGLPAGGSGGVTVVAGKNGTSPATAANPFTVSVDKLGTTTRTPLWATGQVLTTSATSAASTAITGTEVMISVTQDTWIKIGAATPTAAKDTAGSMFLAKGGPYTFQMTTGHLVAAVQDSAAGKVSILPVA